MDIPRIEIDGGPATADQLAYPAIVNYGHFTAMQVRGGAVSGLDLHLRQRSPPTPFITPGSSGKKAQRRHARETLLNAADMAINPSVSMDSVRAEVRPVIEPEAGDLADDAALLSGVHDGGMAHRAGLPGAALRGSRPDPPRD